MLVVEADHPVIGTHRQVRDRKIVITWPGQTLEVMTEVVGEHAGDTPLEGRQAGQRRHLKMFENLRETIEGIGGRQDDGHVVDEAGRGPNPGEGIGSNIGITAQPRVLSTVQKEQVRPGGEAAASIPGRQARKLLHDRRRGMQGRRGYDG